MITTPNPKLPFLGISVANTVLLQVQSVDNDIGTSVYDFDIALGQGVLGPNATLTVRQLLDSGLSPNTTKVPLGPYDNVNYAPGDWIIAQNYGTSNVSYVPISQASASLVSIVSTPKITDQIKAHKDDPSFQILNDEIISAKLDQSVLSSTSTPVWDYTTRVDWTAAPVKHWVTKRFEDSSQSPDITTRTFQEMALPPSYMRIGCVPLLQAVGPTNLMVQDTPQLQVMQALRSSTALKRLGGVVRKTVTFTLLFPSDAAIRAELIPLIRQARRAPFVPVIHSGLMYEHNITALAIQAISVTTVPQFPQTLEATIVAYPFPADRFMLDGDLLDTCFNYPLLELWLASTEGQTISYYESQNADPVTITWNGQLALSTPNIDWLDSANENQTKTDRQAIKKQDSSSVANIVSVGADALSSDPVVANSAINQLNKLGSKEGKNDSVVLVDEIEIVNSGDDFANGTYIAFELTSDIAPYAYLPQQSGGPLCIILTSDGDYKTSCTGNHSLIHGNKITDDQRSALEKAMPASLYQFSGNAWAIWQTGGPHPTINVNNGTTVSPSVILGLKTVTDKEIKDPLNPLFDSPYVLDGFTINKIEAGFANTLAEIAPGDAENPEYQTLGSSDIVIEFSGIMTIDAVNILRDALDSVFTLAVKYRGNQGGSPIGGYFKIDNEIANMLGMRYALPTNVSFNSVDGFPNIMQTVISFVQYDPTQRRIEIPSDFSLASSSIDSGKTIKNPDSVNVFTDWVKRSKAYETVDMHLSTIDLYPDIQPPTWELLCKWANDLKLGNIWKEDDTGVPNPNPEPGYEFLTSWPYRLSWMKANAKEFMNQPLPYPLGQGQPTPVGYADPDFYCCGRGSSSRKSGRAFIEQILEDLANQKTPLMLTGSDGMSGSFEFGGKAFKFSPDTRTASAAAEFVKSYTMTPSGQVRPVPQCAGSNGGTSSKNIPGSSAQESTQSLDPTGPYTPDNSTFYASGLNDEKAFEAICAPSLDAGSWTQYDVDALKDACGKTGVPLVIAANLAYAETGGGISKSRSGAAGMLQLEPGTFSGQLPGVNGGKYKLIFSIPDTYEARIDSVSNTLVGLDYFKGLYTKGYNYQSGQSVTEAQRRFYATQYAAACYNAGPSGGVGFKQNPSGFLALLQNRYGGNKDALNRVDNYVKKVLRGVTIGSFQPNGGVNTQTLAQQASDPSKDSNVLTLTLNAIGTTDVWDPSQSGKQNAFDGSGFTQHIYSVLNTPISASSLAQMKQGNTVNSNTTDDLYPGDILFTTDPTPIASIYVGNGEQVSALTAGGTIQKYPVDINKVQKAIRVINNTQDGAPDVSTKGYEDVYNKVWEFDRAAYDHQNGEDIFYAMRRSDMTGRLLRAFPTALVLLVNGSRWLGFYHMTDTFYGLHSPMDIQTYSSMSTPVDTCTITFGDLYNNLSAQTQDVAFAQLNQTGNQNNLSWSKDLSQNVAAIDAYVQGLVGMFIPTSGIDLRREQEQTSLLIKPGNRLHVRLGYGSQANNLPTVFNGVISQVEHEDDMVSIVALGDGCELFSQLSNVNGDNQNSFYQTTALGGGGREIRDIMLGILSDCASDYNPNTTFGPMVSRNPYGIEHFGDTYKFIFKDTTEVGINCYSGWGDQPINTTVDWENAGLLSILTESIDLLDQAGEEAQKNTFSYFDKNHKNYIDSMGMNQLFRCALGEELVGLKLENATPWGIFDTLRLASLDYVCSVEPFSLRSTLFFGKSWWPFHYRYNYETLDNTDLTKNLNTTAEGTAINNDPDSENFYRRRPLLQVHYCHTGSNLIASRINATSEGWYRSVQAIGSFAGTLQPEISETSYVMYLDPWIFPEFQNTKLVQSGLYSTPAMRAQEGENAATGAFVGEAAAGAVVGGIVGIPGGLPGIAAGIVTGAGVGLAAGLISAGGVLLGSTLLQTNVLNNYATGVLHDEVRNMYNGNIYVIGNGWMRPRHIVHISDTMKQITGPVEIKEVSHTFGTQGGFVTVWTPNPIAFAQDTQFSGIVSHSVTACSRILATAAVLKGMNTVRGSNIARSVIQKAINLFAWVDETTSRALGARFKNQEYHLTRIGRNLFNKTGMGRYLIGTSRIFNVVEGIALSRTDAINAINDCFDNHPEDAIGKLRRTQGMVREDVLNDLLPEIKNRYLAMQDPNLTFSGLSDTQRAILDKHLRKVASNMLKILKPDQSVRDLQDDSLLRALSKVFDNSSRPVNIVRNGRNKLIDFLSDKERLSRTLRRVGRSITSRSVVSTLADRLDDLGASPELATRIRSFLDQDYENLGIRGRVQKFSMYIDTLLEENRVKQQEATDSGDPDKKLPGLKNEESYLQKLSRMAGNVEAGTEKVSTFTDSAGATIARGSSRVIGASSEEVVGTTGGTLLGTLAGATTVIGVQALVNWVNRSLASRHSLNLIPLQQCGKEFSAGINGHLDVVAGDALGPVDQLINSTLVKGEASLWGISVDSLLGIKPPTYVNKDN